MARARLFDWDEAAQLYAHLGTYTAVADTLGVSASAVRRVLVPGLREQMDACGRAWQSEHKPWIGVCPDCGGPASNGRGQRARCRDCHAKRITTTVRPDSLQCCCCRLWLPDDDFPHRAASKSRRGRHQVCRPCGTIARRIHRAEHPELQAAANARARARRRAASHMASGELS